MRISQKKHSNTDCYRYLTALPSLLLMCILLIGFSALTPGLASSENLINLANQQVSLVAVVIGQTLVILTGGLDLSVGSIVSLSTAMCSMDLPYGIPVILALVAAIVVGGINAFGILKWQIHPILMTLSTMTAVQGVALYLRPIPGGTIPSFLQSYSNSVLLELPFSIWMAVLLTVVAWVLLHKSRFGLHVYAVGGSSTNANLAGMNVSRTIAWTYILSAICACLGGINLSGRISGGDPLIGQAFATDSIAAVALGGVLLSGGMGSIPGPIAGVAILALLGNGFNFWNISTHYQTMVKGLLLIIAVSSHRRDATGL